MGCIFAKTDDDLLNSDHKTSNIQICSGMGKVVEVYDGDTCKVNMKLDNKIYKINCRLYGINTLELKDKNEEKMSKAIKAKIRLINLCTGINEKEIETWSLKKSNIVGPNHKKIVYITTHGYDKYGRLLITLFHNENMLISINNQLVIEKLASEYYGRGEKEDLDSISNRII